MFHMFYFYNFIILFVHGGLDVSSAINEDDDEDDHDDDDDITNRKHYNFI